jgi:hypothetical protein
MDPMTDLTLATLDRDEALSGALAELCGSTRVDFLRGAALGGAAMLGALAAPAHAARVSDLDILRFALRFERLQATFYTQAEELGTIARMADRRRRWARTLGAHERAHVKIIKEVLGPKAEGPPSFDFGNANETDAAFTRTAVAMEDLTVALLGGVTPKIQNRGLTAALFGLLTVEARHAAWARHIVKGHAGAGRVRPAPHARVGAARRGQDAVRRGAAKDAIPRQAALHGLNVRAARRRRRIRGGRGRSGGRRACRGGGRSRDVGRPPRTPPRSAAVTESGPGLPAAAVPAFSPGPPRRLGSRRHLAHWAPVERPVTAHRARDAGSPAVGALATTTPEGTRNIVAVLARAHDGNGQPWVRVALPVLPNGTTGWVPRSALGGYQTVRTRLEVDIDALHATLRRNGRPVLRFDVAVGRRGWETPRGRFYVRNQLTRYRSAEYGPIAFGTSARSPAATDWPAGGFVGIHGTDRPDLVPGRVSHGCIRMRNADILALAREMPVGTPVVIG